MHQRLGQLQNDRHFECFGLLEEEFSSIAAPAGMQGLLHILLETRGQRAVIFIGGDDAFSSVGFIMARFLLHSGKRSSVVCDGDFVRNATPIGEAIWMKQVFDTQACTWMESRRAM